MSVTKHKTGGFRAYKKINGEEYQFYSHDINECHVKQHKFDKLAQDTKKITPVKHFDKVGFFFGFSLALRRKKNSYDCYNYSLFMRKQLYIDDKAMRAQCTGNCADMVNFAFNSWCEFFNISDDQLIDYAHKIQKAKSLYTARYHQLKEEMNSEIERIG
jgi:hypothetical protein